MRKKAKDNNVSFLRVEYDESDVIDLTENTSSLDLLHQPENFLEVLPRAAIAPQTAPISRIRSSYQT